MTSYGKHQNSSNSDLSRFGILTEMHTWKRKLWDYLEGKFSVSHKPQSNELVCEKT